MADSPTPVNGAAVKLPIVFQLSDRLIDGVVVKPLMFQQFVDVVAEAQKMQTPKTWEARVRRQRMLRQVTYYTNGSTTPLSSEELTQMPIPAARVIGAKLDEDNAKPGKVIRKGDGIDQAITYELGTPIPVGQGKEPIKELEFLAKTYGDIEDVLAAPDPVTQASVLIATIAKPLGTSLSALPSWALNQITVADGMTVSNEILPVFLGSPTES